VAGLPPDVPGQTRFFLLAVSTPCLSSTPSVGVDETVATTLNLAIAYELALSRPRHQTHTPGKPISWRGPEFRGVVQCWVPLPARRGGGSVRNQTDARRSLSLAPTPLVGVEPWFVTESHLVISCRTLSLDRALVILSQRPQKPPSSRTHKPNYSESPAPPPPAPLPGDIP